MRAAILVLLVGCAPRPPHDDLDELMTALAPVCADHYVYRAEPVTAEHRVRRFSCRDPVHGLSWGEATIVGSHVTAVDMVIAYGDPDPVGVAKRIHYPHRSAEAELIEGTWKLLTLHLVNEPL